MSTSEYLFPLMLFEIAPVWVSVNVDQGVVVC